MKNKKQFYDTHIELEDTMIEIINEVSHLLGEVSTANKRDDNVVTIDSFIAQNPKEFFVKSTRVLELAEDLKEYLSLLQDTKE